MKIVVSMITLNEEQYIQKAVESCEFADDIVIADGGSTDKTYQILSKIEGIWIGQPTWANHFGDQRQHSLDLVPNDADWWMRLDSDERYSQSFIKNIRPMLESIPDHIMAIRIRQVNLVQDENHYSARRGGWETHPRIFRNVRLPDGKSAWKWVGQVHEYCRLLTVNGLTDPETYTLNLPVIHYGWLNEERRAEREELYTGMKGSGFQAGSLTQRRHVMREL